jgi:hypothetical protein
MLLVADGGLKSFSIAESREALPLKKSDFFVSYEE